MAQAYFSPKVFTFLKELDSNNNKEWWEANKERYIETIREPALAFIADFEPQLHSMSPHFVADTHLNGGSLMRPYRDVRFSRDKTPYKTNVGIQFRHESGKDVHAPGFYVHIEPGQCFSGVGMWHPEPKVARVIRQNIYDNPADWKKATRGKAFTDTWHLDTHENEMLKRVPREFDSGHAFADDLRMKSFIAGRDMSQKTVTSSDLDAQLGASFRKASRLTEFLCSAVGIPY